MFMRRLMVGLVLSLFGSAIFTFWLSTKLKSKPEVKLHYLAPVANMDAGQPLTKESLKTVDWPASTPVTGAFTKPEDLIGRTVIYPVSAGEPILDHQLAGVGAGAGLSPHIPDGMRAISLKSDAVTGVAGFLLPGTHVDVLVTYKQADADGVSGTMVTSTVIQDVPILTAGQQMQPDPTGKPAPTDVVTLLVTPIDAEKATLASSQGTIHFILRNGTDHDHVSDSPMQLVSLDGSTPGAPTPRRTRGPGQYMPGTRQNGLQLWGGGGGMMPPQQAAAAAPAAPKAEQKPKGYQVQTIIGNKQSVESF